jgi:cytochrome c-type biogenesis protein CcmH
MRKTPVTGLIALVLCLAAVLNPLRVATAQQPTPSDDAVNAIASQLFCPVCENVPLDVCPTQACAQWRELIREKLAAGWSERQIIDYFIEQYGARVVGVPPAVGQDLMLYWLLYLILGVSVLGGIFFLYKAVRNRDQSAEKKPPVEAGVQPPSREYVDRMEEELKRR